MTGKLVVISGPSGAGKSTIAKAAMARAGAQFSISATTRKPRPAETDGQDYRFIDRPEFEEMIQAGAFIEWAEVFGQLYGTPAEPVRSALADGRTILLDVDVQGGRQVHQKMPSATFILIVPPSDAELASRLSKRGSEDEAEIARRLSKANEEIAAAKSGGMYNHVIINDKLDEAIRQVVEIVEK